MVLTGVGAAVLASPGSGVSLISGVIVVGANIVDVSEETAGAVLVGRGLSVAVGRDVIIGSGFDVGVDSGVAVSAGTGVFVSSRAALASS